MSRRENFAVLLNKRAIDLEFDVYPSIADLTANLAEEPKSQLLLTGRYFILLNARPLSDCRPFLWEDDTVCSFDSGGSLSLYATCIVHVTSTPFLVAQVSRKPRYYCLRFCRPSLRIVDRRFRKRATGATDCRRSISFSSAKDKYAPRGSRSLEITAAGDANSLLGSRSRV